MLDGENFEVVPRACLYRAWASIVDLLRNQRNCPFGLPRRTISWQ